MTSGMISRLMETEQLLDETPPCRCPAGPVDCGPPKTGADRWQTGRSRVSEPTGSFSWTTTGSTRLWESSGCFTSPLQRTLRSRRSIPGTKYSPRTTWYSETAPSGACITCAPRGVRRMGRPRAGGSTAPTPRATTASSGRSLSLGWWRLMGRSATTSSTPARTRSSPPSWTQTPTLPRASATRPLR